MKTFLRAGQRVLVMLSALILFCPVVSGLGADEKIQVTMATLENTPNTIDRVIYYALEQLGLDVSVNCYGATSAIAVVNDSEIDILSFQTMSVLEDNPNLVVVPEPLGIREYRVYTRKGEGTDRIYSWNDFSGKDVAYPLVGPYIQSRMPEDVNSTCNELLSTKLFEGLFAGDYDYVVISASIGQDSLNITDGVECVGILDRQYAYTFVNRKQQWLVPVLEAEYREMKKNGVMDAIINRTLQQDDASAKEILFISSYTTNDLEMELRNGFTDKISLEDNSIYYYNFNARQYQNDVQREQYIINLMRSDFIDHDPDVIVVVGNEALKLIKECYNLVFKNVPVVFCNIDGYSQEDIKGFENYFTGTAPEISALDTVKFAYELFPYTTEVYVINDYTDAGLSRRDEISKQLKDYNVTFSPNVSMQQLLTEVAGLPETAVVLFGNYSVDGDGRYFSQSESQDLFDTYINVPAFGLLDIDVRRGQIGGKCISAYDQGVLVEELVSRILSGGEITDMPVITESGHLNRWVLNKTAMDKWGIRNSQLPDEEIEIINAKLSVWESNPTEFYLFVMVITVSLLALLFMSVVLRAFSRKNKQLVDMQKDLHTAEEMLEKDNTIKEVKTRLENIISSAPVGFTLTKDGVLFETNGYVKKLFDIELGEKVDKLFDTRTDCVLNRGNIHKYGIIKDSVVTLVTAAGEKCRFIVNGTKIDYNGEPAYVQWIVNIEESERVKDEIKRAYEDMETIIHALPLPVMMLDTSKVTIELVNHKFMEMFGFDSAEQAKTTSYYDLFPVRQDNDKLTKDLIAHNIRSVDAIGPVHTWERTYKLLNGEFREAQVTCGRVIYKERDTFILILRDVSAEREYNRTLQRIAEREKEDNKLKSSFLVNMSHEIRTPMNAIIGLSELALRKGGSPEIMTDTLEKISESAKILLTIINDILDFSKIESGKLDFANEEFLLEEVLSNATLVASQRLKDKPVEMLVSIAPEVPVSLMGDKTRVWQIIKNFLDNSAKFTNSGRIVCEVSVFDAEPHRIWMTFVITDTGIGISSNNIERIFRPFEQVVSSVQFVHAGTGLGMSISKQLVESMGGSITLSSREGEGTRVQCIIPFNLTDKEVTFKDFAPREQLEGKSILIADDDVVALEIMASLLEDARVKLTCVTGGEEAIEHVMTGNKYDVIILDYRLKGLNGIETAKEITDKYHSGAKLLMVSAFSKQLIEDETKKAGFADVIEKPFSPTTFYSKIAAALGLVTADTKNEEEILSFPNARVLLCEDNFINQQVALGMLEEYGINAIVAENGQKAIEILENKDFDLVLMDIIMPVMDGHEAVKRIRGSAKPYRDVPVVAMTANAMLDEIQKCLSEGMNGHIAKPVDINELKNTLVKYLGGNHVTGN